MKTNCSVNFQDNKELKDIIPPYENLGKSCKIDSGIEDIFNSNLDLLRKNISSICEQISGITGDNTINVNQLLRFSDPDVCNAYQIKVEKDISNNFNNYPIQSIINTKLSGNQVLYYFSDVDENGGVSSDCADQVSLNSPVYGENYLTKSQACKILSVRFVKVLNIIGCVLVFLLESSDLIRKDEGDIEPNRSSGVNISQGIPFFQQQLDTILQTNEGGYNINLCNTNFFNLYTGKNNEGIDIKINDILPISIFQNLYKK